jgi:hypothetical protein
MALTLNNFIGFETGGLEEASQTAGSPSATTSDVRTGSYALSCPANADQYLFDPHIVADAGTDYVVGFAIKFSSFSAGTFFRARDDDDPVREIISVEITGTDPYNLRISDGITDWDGSTNLETDKWYYIEVWWESTGTDNATLFLDGASEITATSGDFDTGFNLNEYQFIAITNLTFFVDDIYAMSGATGTGDFLGPRTEVLGAYQNTAEDATDQGSALNNGTWADVGHTPFFDGTQADYQQNGAIAGYTICDEGNRAGPAGDAPGTITGAKYIHRMARTNGSSPTTLDKSYGNSVDGVTSKDMASVLLVAYANFFEVSEAAGVVPTNSENFAFGMGQTGSGGRDVLAHEMCGMLLHVHPALSTTLADMNFPDQNYYLGPFGT